MSEYKKTSNTSSKSESKKFEDFIVILVKYRKSIFINLFVITISAIIISLVLEKRYTATASLMPPKMKESMGGLSSTIENITNSMMGRLGNVSEESYNYLAILQSRSASEKVINKFKLKKIYQMDDNAPLEDVLRALKNNVEFSIEDEGNFLISVTDKNPVRAANIANYYVEILNEISTFLSVTEARSNREFIERRYNKNIKDLRAAEDSMYNFQKKFGIFAVPEQLEASVKSAAALEAQLVQQELIVDLLQQQYGVDFPHYIEMKNQLDKLIFKVNELKKASKLSYSSNVLFPFSEVPTLTINYYRIFREIEIQTKILGFVLPMYEQALVEEQKNIPVVLILDKAIPPEKKSSPKRMIIVLSAFLLSLFSSIIFAIFRESYTVLQRDEVRYNRIKNDIINPMKNSFRIRKR